MKPAIEWLTHCEHGVEIHYAPHPCPECKAADLAALAATKDATLAKCADVLGVERKEQFGQCIAEGRELERDSLVRSASCATPGSTVSSPATVHGGGSMLSMHQVGEPALPSGPAAVQPEEIPCRHCGKLPNDHYYGDQRWCDLSTNQRPRPAYEPEPQPEDEGQLLERVHIDFKNRTVTHEKPAPQPAGGAGEKLEEKCRHCELPKERHFEQLGRFPCPIILDGKFYRWSVNSEYEPLKQPCPRCADLERERDEARQQAHYIAEGTVIPQLDQLIQKYQAISQSGWTLARTRNERINALEAKRDTLQARVSEMEKDASALMTSMNEASRFTLELEKKQAARISKLETALREIASKSRCECWDVPGMGSGLSPKWKGCAAHNSDDPEEWCLCCIATAALGEKEAGEKKTP